MRRAADFPEADRFTGFLSLSMENKNGRTVIRDAYHTGAFKISRPFDPDGSGQVCIGLLNPGGGYVDGDRYMMRVELKPGAELLLTTQSATKIYRTPRDEVVSRAEIRLGARAVLEYLPDPVIAYGQARYRQHTVVRMDRGASFVSADIFTPGWSRTATLFAYERLQNSLEVYVDDELVLCDRLRIVPDGSESGLGIFEGYTHYGSLLVIHERGTEAELERLHGLLASGLSGTDVKFGVTSLLAPGLMLRILARSTGDVLKAFGIGCDFVRTRWLGKKPVRLRKY